MITLAEQPPSIPSTLTDPKAPPVPISDCWRWCLQPDAADAVTTPGSKATVEVLFPLTTTVPADGTAFKIWGYDFTVQSAEDFTSESFKVETSGLLTALNFGSMIQANIYFSRAVIVTGGIVGSDFQVLLTWNECREQPRFSVDDMVFTGITATGGSATATNGVSPVYVEAFQIVSRLGFYQDATQTFLPISSFVGMEPNRQCTTVGQICPEYPLDAESALYTDLPDLTSTSFIPAIQGGRSLMRLFSLEYGWTYREDCGAKSGTIKKSPLVLGINAAFDIDDPYQMRRYWYAHPDGFPDGQFVPDYLTTQPKTIPLCWQSFKWLWLLNNWQDEFGQYRLVARFVLYKKGVSGVFEIFTHVINNPLSDAHSWYQPVNFNVSPQFVLDNAPTLNESNLDFYEVQVVGMETLTTDILFNASEYLRFVPGHCCEGTTDLYFLTPPGGIGTVVVNIAEENVVQEGQEIFLQTDCGASRNDRARYGGRTLVGLRSYKEITFTINAPPNVQWRRWLKHLRASPQHWIRVEDEAGISLGFGGNPLAKKLIVEPGSAKIYENGSGIEFKATGYLADIPTQKGYEP